MLLENERLEKETDKEMSLRLVREMTVSAETLHKFAETLTKEQRNTIQCEAYAIIKAGDDVHVLIDPESGR